MVFKKNTIENAFKNIVYLKDELNWVNGFTFYIAQIFIFYIYIYTEYYLDKK